jgi:hypothetical protein
MNPIKICRIVIRRRLALLAAFVAALAAAPPAHAQTANVANFNTLTINGAGAGGTSAIAYDTAVTSATLNLGYAVLPASPVILASAATANPGGLAISPNNSLDIDPATLAVILDGTGILVPGVLAPFLESNVAGLFSLAVPNAFVTTLASSIALQGAAVNPAYAAGFNTTAAFVLRTPILTMANAACTFGAVAVAAGANTSTFVDLTPGGFAPWFTFYGVAYGSIFTNANGCLTSSAFVSGGETLSAFLGGNTSTQAAKICPYWDDFDFSVSPGSSLTAYINDTPGAEIAEFCWTNVREDGQTNPNSVNTFKATLTSTMITFDYGNMASIDGLVGLSPGGNPSIASGLLLNLTLGASNPPFNAAAPFSAPYQIFTSTSPNDLPGARLHFVLGTAGGTAGVPTSVF